MIVRLASAPASGPSATSRVCPATRTSPPPGFGVVVFGAGFVAHPFGENNILIAAAPFVFVDVAGEILADEFDH